MADLPHILPAMLTPAQAAEFLQCSRKTLDRMLRDGTLSSCKLGRAKSAPVRISRDKMLQELGLVTRGSIRRRRRAANVEYHQLMAQLG